MYFLGLVSLTFTLLLTNLKCNVANELNGESLTAGKNAPAGVVQGTGNTVGIGQGKEQWRGEIIRLSWEPRAYLLKNFLSDEECEYLVSYSKNKLEDSIVIDNDTGAPQKSEVRTSKGTFIPYGFNKKIKEIEDRVAQVTMIPTAHQEAMQILHYENGQKYEPHHDYFHDPVNALPENGGQRIVTVLMYLSTPEEGGETVFPSAAQRVYGDEWSTCARKGYAVKATKGDALMFYGLHPNGTADPTSLHGSCPTTKGEKWSATKWIHVLPLYGKMDDSDPRCRNDHDRCTFWASQGECDKNAQYMKTSCRKACGTCDQVDASITTTVS
eukprot:TRINITY_DN86746_c0_g1_i4.p1 TRINITY_DN86746_c0_g1~~TRINITY_DN86746_c0_g1_i4.p1  ORF type:complete len:349 (-),score=30.08 TRINITY_DN86746_c0_g1_i4:213-1193(-)